MWETESLGSIRLTPESQVHICNENGNFFTCPL